jgi:GH24 family phage-related lysozyme (muramidase)
MILQIGSNGSAVAQLQLNLNQLAHAGVFKLPVGELKGTGTFGENTEATVKAFQKSQQLEVDGIAGPDTLGRIDTLRGGIIASAAGPVDTGLRGAVIDKLLAIAQAEVGVREVGGNNCGARVRDYQRATELRPLGDWPWCAAFVSWVIREWLAGAPEACRAMGWKNEEVEGKRPKTAGAFAYLDWARRFDQEILPPTATPEPGMIAVFDFSHIGFVKKALAGRKFRSIEGNTNGRGDRDSVSGDGVWEKDRAVGLVRNFIRFRFVAGVGEGHFVSNAVPSPEVLPNTGGIAGIPREALEFIIDEEGMDQPWRFPGGDSGVTLGHGYDLGAGTESKAEMLNDWRPWLSGSQLDRLSAAIGKTGDAAKALCPSFRDITITAEAADDVFFRATVPKYYQRLVSAFPNAGKLPGIVQGALLSLVFNRGTSMKGDRREEMRNIRELLAGEPPYDLRAVAAELRSMKRLWEGKGLAGLITRREREARMVESAIA